MSAVRVWICRHGEVESHRGDVPVTPAGLEYAETVGARLAERCQPGSRIRFLHAPTLRTLQTAEAIRRGMGSISGELEPPRVEHAIRNPDLYVAGHRVEMVSSSAALAAQLPDQVLSADELERLRFFAAFWGTPDRIGTWLDDPDPPGERAQDVARRFLTFARSLADAPVADGYVCVTHSGPMRAILRSYVLDHDPGEPEYVEPIELELTRDGEATWRFRETVSADR